MEENLLIYAKAIDSGYVSLVDLVAWADQQVLQVDQPPHWLLELCLARTEQEASGALWMERNRQMGTVGHEWPDPARHDDIYLGFLYLRFERGDLTMAELLELAGRYSDAQGCSIACETDQADCTSSDRWCEPLGAGYDRRRRAARTGRVVPTPPHRDTRREPMPATARRITPPRA